MTTPKLESAIRYPVATTVHLASDRSPFAAEAQVLRLFDECAPGLRRYVASFGLGSATTDDLVQEVFLALFRHLRLGRPSTNLKGWLFQVARNLALKHRHATVRRQVIETVWNSTLAEEVLDPASNPEESLADRRRQRRLRTVLSQLPERDRRCVYLRAEGLCYRDIGKALGISLGTVAKSLVRAFSRLTAAAVE